LMRKRGYQTQTRATSASEKQKWKTLGFQRD
jgi:hypothetical protein